MNPQHQEPPPWSRAADTAPKNKRHKAPDGPDGGGNDGGNGGPKWGRLVALFALVVGIIMVASWLYPGEMSTDQTMRIIYLLVLVAVIGGSRALWSRIPMTKAVKYGAVWLGIFAVAIGIGSFWDDLGLGGRLTRSVLPGVATTSDAGEIVIYKRSDGHFYLFADVNGARTLFLVDTGATQVSLTPEDAVRAGIQVSAADYYMTVQTANGEAKAAPVTIEAITVDGLVMRDVAGHVGNGGMGESLLGMSYLERFSSYEVRGSEMYLRP